MKYGSIVKPFILVLGSWLLAAPGRAQTGKSAWQILDNLTPANMEDRLLDAQRLPDGRLALSGHTREKTAPAQGLLVLFDPASGQWNRAQPASLQSGPFEAVAQAPDGRLWVAETREVRGSAQITFRCFDETGQPLTTPAIVPISGKNPKIGFSPHGVLLMACLNSRKNLEIWHWKPGSNAPLRVDSLAGQKFNTVAFAGPTPEGNWWFAGNYTNNDAWCLQLDARGRVRGHLKRLPAFKLTWATVTAGGNLMACGYSFETATGNPGGKIVETACRTDAGPQIQQTTLLAPEAGRTFEKWYTNACCQSPSGQRFVLLQRDSRPPEFVQLDDATHRGKNFGPLPGAKNFNPFHLLSTDRGDMLAAGIAAGKLMMYTGTNLAPPTATPVGSSPVKAVQLTLLDNGDSLLTTGERAALHLALKSESSLGALSIYVRPDPLVPGLTALYDSLQPYRLFAQTTEASVVLGIRQDQPHTGLDSARLHICITRGAKTLLVIPAVIALQARKKENPYLFSFIKPDLLRDGAKVRWQQGADTLQLAIFSKEQLHDSEIILQTERMGAVQEWPGACRLYGNANASSNPNYPYEYRCLCPLVVDTGTTSVWISAGFERRGSPKLQILYRERKPVLYVFPVGISAAAHGPESAWNDARDFADAMSRQRHSGFYEQVVVDSTFISTPLAATRVGILNQLEQFKNQYCLRSREQWHLDYLVFFFSGHGQIQHDRFYLEPVGGEERANLIDYEDLLRDYFNPIPAKKFLFIDACREERGKKGPGDLAEYLFEANKVADAICVFQSSSLGQASWDCPGYQNGVYTEALLEALAGEARADCPGSTIVSFTVHSGVIRVSELQAFLHKRVPELSRCCGKRPQNPQIEKLSEAARDLPLFFISP